MIFLNAEINSIFITPFVHIYEMFAGICAALVGVSEIRELTATKFGEKFEVRSKKIKEDIGKIISNVKQSQLTYKASIQNVKRKPPQLVTSKIESHDNEIREIEEWAKKISVRYNLASEQQKVVNIVYALCVLVFLFAASLMFFIASVENGFIIPGKAISQVAHSEIVMLPTLIFVSVQINKANFQKYSVFLFSLLMFFMSELVSLSVTYCIKCHFSLYENLILICSLIICTFPFVALLTRTYIVWKYRFTKDDKDIVGRKERAEIISKDYQDVLDFIIEP